MTEPNDSETGLGLAYERIVRRIARPIEHLVAVTPDTRWVWSLFPALLHLRLRSVGIRAVVGPATYHDAAEQSRRQLLRWMGVELEERDRVTMGGFRFVEKSGELGDTVGLPRGPANCVNRTVDVVPQLPTEVPRRRELSPELRLHPEADLFQRLHAGVEHYRAAGVTMRAETVPIAGLRVVSPLVRRYKLLQAQLLIHDVYGVHLPFATMAVRFAGGDYSIVTPPIVERHGDSLVLIEGTTRALHCWRRRLGSFRAIVVDGVEAPPPAAPVPLAQVSLTLEAPERSRRHFEPSLFRPIEQAVHQPLAS